MTRQLARLLDSACNAARPAIGEGRVARYIPALARVDPRKFGAAVVTVDGDMVTYGDAAEPFSIQSISKVFTLTRALAEMGDALWQRVGREPSGSSFNSIVQLEHENGIPRNPLINAGAIVVCDALLAARSADEAAAHILAFMRHLACDESIEIDAEVAASERATGYRNASLANFLRAFGNLRHDVDEVLSIYFRQCAIDMSCVQLARAALFLAGDGVDPLTNERIVYRGLARRIKSIMLMCGHYDASGDFAYSVGLPGKSGVGGGIVVVAPYRAAVAVWSPGLNEAGNSHAGTLALEHLARETGWSVF